MSTNNLNTTALEQLPNPFTPLAFLPPALASQFEVSNCINTFTLGAFVWDLAANLNSDYYLLFVHKIRITTVVYYISRVMTLAYVTCCVVFQFGRLGDCQALVTSLGVFYLLSGSATAFLFFIRVQAVFSREKYVKMFFFVLWLSVVAGLATVPFGIKAGHITGTKFCINTSVKSYTGACAIVTIVNDSLVFMAISHRILSVMTYHDSTLKGRLEAFLGRANLPAVSRALLQSGQQYYLITVGGNVVLAFLIFSKDIPALEHALFTIPNLALGNAMACIVFRQIRFGLIAADATSHFDKSIKSIQVGANSVSAPQHLSEGDGRIYERSTNNTSSLNNVITSMRPGMANTIEIGITKSTELDQPIPLEVLLPRRRTESYEMPLKADTKNESV